MTEVMNTSGYVMSPDVCDVCGHGRNKHVEAVTGCNHENCECRGFRPWGILGKGSFAVSLDRQPNHAEAQGE